MQYHSLIIFFGGCVLSVAMGESSKGVTEPHYISEDSKEPMYDSIEGEDYNEDSKEYMYDDFEGNTTKHSEGTTEVPLPSVKSFTFLYIKNILNVTFMPSYVDEDYRVILMLAYSMPIEKYIKSAKRVESAIFQQQELAYRKYTIIIQCVFCNGRSTTESLMLDGYRTDALDCTSWNVISSLNADHRLHSITAVVTPYQKYKLCFENYTVNLYEFNGGCQVKDSSLIKTDTALYNNTEKLEVTFTDLLPGNYCASIIAKHQDCPRDMNCGVRSIDDAEELRELKIENELLKNINEVPLLAIVLLLSVFAVVLIVGVIGGKKLKNYLIDQLPTLKNSYGKESPGNAAASEEKLIVSILKAQSTDLHQDVALAIDDFLKDCCNVHSVIADKDPEFFMNRSAWIQNNFNYNHLLSSSVKHKILILETDAAVKLYTNWMNVGKEQQIKNNHYSHLDDIFLRGLTELLSSPEYRGTDHHHIIVVRFPYFSSELSCFEQKRLYLPDQAVQLYNSLWDNKDLLYDENNLKSKWREKEAFQKLLKAIQKLANYVENNPKYLEHTFGYPETV